MSRQQKAIALAALMVVSLANAMARCICPGACMREVTSEGLCNSGRVIAQVKVLCKSVKMNPAIL